MKKIASILFFKITAIHFCIAQIGMIVDFENINLGTTNYYLDSLSNDYTSGPLNFQYDYDSIYNYWSAGFSCSAVQDSTTSGFGNLYGCKALSGQNGSQKYAVGQQNSRLSFVSGSGPGVVNGLYVCNSTYAFNSMRDGDQFAKKFGGTSGNDPDWFRLTIRSYFNGVLTSDSVEFFLADFRFSNNSLDYLVSDWTYINTQSLGSVDSLQFSLSSSDNGLFGMNTPAFFCIDDIQCSPFININETGKDNQLSVYPNPAQNFISINSIQEKISKIEIINMEGISLKEEYVSPLSNYNTIELSELNSGIYFLKITTSNKTKLIKIIKQ